MILQNFLLAFPLFFLVGLGFFSAKVNLIDFNVGKGLAKFADDSRGFGFACTGLEYRLSLLRLVHSGFSVYLLNRPKKFSFAR